MQAHYYCEKCGHFEVLDTSLFGLDLPKIKCPKCGSALLGDGYNLPIESVWGNDGNTAIGFEYLVSSEIFPFALRVIKASYPENEIVTYGLMSFEGDPRDYDPEKVKVIKGGYVILPQGRTFADYEEISSYLEDGEPCICCLPHELEKYGLKKISLYTHVAADYLMELQRKSGMYVMEIGNSELRELNYYNLVNTRVLDKGESSMLNQRKPGKYSEMANLIAVSHNTFFDISPANEAAYWEIETEVLRSEDFQQFPCYTREDFFECLMRCGLEREAAYRWSEVIRKGRAKRTPEFEALPIPDALKNVAKRYMYTFPRAHVIEFTLMYARLAYYQKWNSRVYSTVVRRKTA